MSLGHGASIARNGLVLALDGGNTKSYTGAGNVWRDLITNTASTGTSEPSELTNPASLSAAPLTELTVMGVVTLLGTSAGYAFHPISKWTGINDATFVLYHFLDFDTPGSGYRLAWYGNRGGEWSTLSSIYQGAIDQTYHVVLQYNSTTGGQMWINGSKAGVRTGSGTLFNNSINIKIDGGPQPRAGIHNTKHVLVYNRELSDNEIIQNYNALRGRYGI